MRMEMEIVGHKKTSAIFADVHMVGIPGFEPGTSCSQSRHTNRTVLHPEWLFV